MNQMKAVGLAMLAVLITLSSAGSAHATELYNNGSTTMGAGTTLDFSLKAFSSSVIVNTEGGELDKCSESTIRGKITNAGSSTSTTTVEIEEIIDVPSLTPTYPGLTWQKCTFPTVTELGGRLEIHHIAGTSTGTVTADADIRVRINTVFFGECTYIATSGTDLGTISAGEPATFTANAVLERWIGSAFACPTTAKWTASFRSTTPSGVIDIRSS